MYLFAILLIVAGSATDSIAQIQERIYGGHKAEENQFPYIVAIKDATNGNFVCTGTLINTKWVLTSASCFRKDGGAENVYNIFIGTRGQFKYKSDIVLLHPGYPPPNSSWFVHDLAMLRMLKPIRFEKGIRPVEIGKIENADDKKVVITGWGITNDNKKKHYARDLPYIEMDTLNTKTCSKSYPPGYVFPEKNICMKASSTKATCEGDAGAPVVNAETGRVVGLVPRVEGCWKNQPNVFMNLDSYRYWIEQVSAESH